MSLCAYSTFLKATLTRFLWGKLDPLHCVSCIVRWQRLTAPYPVVEWVMYVRFLFVYAFCLPTSIVRIPGTAESHWGLSLLIPYSGIWHQYTFVVSLSLNPYLWLVLKPCSPSPTLYSSPLSPWICNPVLPLEATHLSSPPTPKLEFIIWTRLMTDFSNILCLPGLSNIASLGILGQLSACLDACLLLAHPSHDSPILTAGMYYCIAFDIHLQDCCASQLDTSLCSRAVSLTPT